MDVAAEEGHAGRSPRHAEMEEPEGAIFDVIRALQAVARRSVLHGTLAALSSVLLMASILSLVFAGGSTNAALAWVMCGLILTTACLRLARLIHSAPSIHAGAADGGAGRAGASGSAWQSRRWAIEQRLLQRHPNLDVQRLQLLLTDRDFTGDDYNMLLALDAHNVVPAALGASEGEIRRLPAFVVKDTDEKQRARSCPVCLFNFSPGDVVRTVPCLHQFHSDCIDPWLRQNSTCPVCKFDATG